MCFTLPCLEGDGPVGVVVADRRRDEEALRQLGVDDDFGAGIEFADERPLVGRVGEDVVVDVAVRLEAFAEVFLLFLREDVDAVGVFERVVGEVLDDNRRLLLVDKRAGL